MRQGRVTSGPTTTGSLQQQFVVVRNTQTAGRAGFADDELCVACVPALGGQSWRSFRADNRGDASLVVAPAAMVRLASRRQL